MNKIIYKILIVFMMTIMAGSATAAELNYIHFDPAIIAAGDEVDIVVQFSGEESALPGFKINDPSYKLQVSLDADDKLTRDYVMIVDDLGDDIKGAIFSGETYYKTFRVKVADNAPTGTYQFKLTGEYYHNDVPMGVMETLRFTMPVKKEGIILDVANLQTIPAEVRPGDEYVQLITNIENVGHKDAKSITVTLEMPEGIEASYSDNNREWIGGLSAGEKKSFTFDIDLDEELSSGVYELKYNIEYMDLDDNNYSKEIIVPFKVKPRPHLEVIKYEGSGLAGKTGELKVWIKNTGTESAESIDARIIKEGSQPFDIDVRSYYVGELEPNEEGVAVFEISSRADANIGEHDFKLLLRSKGDSDEGDDNIYSYSRRAKYSITGTAPNYLLYGGIGLAILIILVLVIKKVGGKK